MSDLFPITIEDEIQELEREVTLRRRVYPRWMAQGKISKVKADRQIAVMQSAEGQGGMMSARPKTADWERLITSVPVNRDAAQAMTEGRSDEHQERENLLLLLVKVERTLQSKMTKEQRKSLGQQKLRIQNRLTELRPHKKRPQYASLFLEAARDILPKPVFRTIGDEAMRRHEQWEADNQSAEPNALARAT